MDSFTRLLRFICLVGLFVISIESGKWDYDGDTGVHHWHRLFPDACSGRYQSPINIVRNQTIYSSKLRDFAIWYDPPKAGTVMKIKNNGHSIKVGIYGECYVTNGGLLNVYKTSQFHFHWGAGNFHGSEHRMDGRQYPLELHVVNYNSDVYNNLSQAITEPKGLAVLGTLFELSDNDNLILEPIIDQLRNVRDPEAEGVIIEPISIRYFLPRNLKNYYRYQGSLTTPGCFESVLWTVFEDTLPISERQLNEFRRVLRPHNRSNYNERRRDTEAEEAVLEELGIASENSQQTNLEMELGKSKMIEEGADVAYNVEGEISTDNFLVNNFRPVQPLNGRNVYRSFRLMENYMTK